MPWWCYCYMTQSNQSKVDCSAEYCRFCPFYKYFRGEVHFMWQMPSTRGDYLEFFRGVCVNLEAELLCKENVLLWYLHEAEKIGGMALQVILDLGGQMETKDSTGATALFFACETGKLSCAVSLMAAGAELRTRNSSGEAPLYIAALKGHERVVEELLAEFNARGLKWTVRFLSCASWAVALMAFPDLWMCRSSNVCANKTPLPGR